MYFTFHFQTTVKKTNRELKVSLEKYECHSYFRYSIMTKCWEEQPKRRPTFQWLCSAVKRLLDDYKVCLSVILEHVLFCFFFFFFGCYKLLKLEEFESHWNEKCSVWELFRTVRFVKILIKVLRAFFYVQQDLTYIFTFWAMCPWPL